ncbi:MAG: hypothetical protein GX410_07885 [Elusimicrobia bacterium]|nr:hypothetical protein [Elusimicrobiota bacterium]
MRLALVFLWFSLALPSAFAGADSAGSETEGWSRKNTSHFTIIHENAMAPQAIAMELEKIYSKLRMHMAAFAPWMDKQKTKVYIYGSQESYQGSSFGPPKWSEALALPASHAVLVYDQNDTDNMRRVLTHELTHVFFGSFFVSNPDALPLWLDEGMATNMEETTYPHRAQALQDADVKSFFPFAAFTQNVPGPNDPNDVVTGWYLQAFGTVKYMYGTRTKLQFITYCKKLLAGSTPEQALWEAYKIRNWKIFDERWRSWLQNEQGSSKGGTGLSSGSSFTSSYSLFNK